MLECHDLAQVKQGSQDGGERHTPCHFTLQLFPLMLANNIKGKFLKLKPSALSLGILANLQSRISIKEPCYFCINTTSLFKVIVSIPQLLLFGSFSPAGVRGRRVCVLCSIPSNSFGTGSHLDGPQP